MRPSPSWCMVLCLASAALAYGQAPAGPPFVVNTYTTGSQDDPQVQVRPAGDFVVAWNRAGTNPYNTDIYGRIYTPAGAPRGDEFRMNDATFFRKRLHSGGLALNASGRGVAVWDMFFGDGSEVWGHVLERGGLPAAGPDQLVLSNNNDLVQAGGQAAIAPDGRYVVAWHDYDSGQILARRFRPGGEAVGGQFAVVTPVPGDEVRLGGVAIDPAGNFIVVWGKTGPGGLEPADVYTRRFDPDGQPAGAEFIVNAATTGRQDEPTVAVGPDGSAVIAWAGPGVGSGVGEIWGRRVSSSGQPVGVDLRLGLTAASADVGAPRVAVGELGDFAVQWNAYGSSGYPDLMLRRFESNGTPRGLPVRFGAQRVLSAVAPQLGRDRVGNLLTVWHDVGLDGDDVFAQRYGGLLPVALAVDASGGGGSNGDGVLQPGESVIVAPTWRNATTATQSWGGVLGSAGGPAGAAYTITDAAGSYGTAPDGTDRPCVDCYGFSVSNPASRPATHWDASVVEEISPDSQGQRMRWPLHVGDSFGDVPRANPFYRHIEALLHHQVSGGCAPGLFCPGQPTTRAQMAVFVLAASEGPAYAPPPCNYPSRFDDVPPISPYCRWVEEMARRGITSGCSATSFCPDAVVTREQMAVFVLRAQDFFYVPPLCAPPNIFEDVPETSLYCRWIEELARRGVVAGCDATHYCPRDAVTREQMAVFLGATFGLTLYGP